MNPHKPSSETILLAVTGMSPAVLTETVWALSREPEPIIPERIIVVTTSAGRQQIISDLFDKRMAAQACVWDALRADLQSSGHDLAGKLRFGITHDDIRVITATNPATGLGVELEDLRSLHENEAAANFLLNQVRAITANPESHLIASIAGGRKTMGALLYACLTLAGREEDRITHVLVNAPHESDPAFFFPGQPGPGKPDAKVELADVPFVPLRNLFHRELGRAVGNFSTLVASCRSEIRHRVAEDLRIEIPMARPALRVNHAEVRLTEREHHMLICLAKLAKTNQPAIPSYGEALDVLADHQTEWNGLIRDGRLPGGSPVTAQFNDEQDVRRVLSDLRRKVRSMGSHGAILADVLPSRGRFSLDVPGSLIHIC